MKAADIKVLKRKFFMKLLNTCRDRCSQAIRSKYFMPCAFLVMAFFLFAKGYCEDNDIQAIETLTNKTIKTIFSPWVRKTALGFGAGFGLFKSFMGGSVVPLLSWGGLGLAVNYIPKLIDVITKVGS